MSDREPQVVEWVNQYPDHDRVMIDAGANEGDYTVQGARLFRQVYAVEPHQQILGRLLSRTEALANVTYVNKALEYPGPLSLLMPDKFERTSFDDLWQEIKGRGQTVGLIKCDIEGAEETAWDNAGQLLDDNRDWLWVILELHRGVRFMRLCGLFMDHGYSWSSYDLHHAGHYLIRKAAPEGAA